MAILLLTVVFGILFAFFATQNTSFVNIRFGQYLLTGMPIYLVVLMSLLVGLFIASIFSFFGWASSSLRIAGRDYRIRNDEKAISDLKENLQKLKEENEVLREQVLSERKEKLEGSYEEAKADTRNFFDRLRHNLSF